MRRCRLALLIVVILPLMTHGAPRADAVTCASPRHVTALAAGPGGSLLAGTRDAGLFRSADGGRCWTRLATYPPGIEIGTLLAPPGQPAVLIAGGSFLVSLEPQSWKLYRSADGGKTWTGGTAGLPRTQILPIRIAATAHGTLVMSYICPHDAQLPQFTARTLLCPQGLARSVDAGRSWHSVGPSWHSTAPSALPTTAHGVVRLADDTLLAVQSTLTAGAYPKELARIYRSRDDGRTWQPWSLLPGDAGPGAASNRQNLAMLFAVPWDAGRLFTGYGVEDVQPVLYRSTDGGVHWSLAWRPNTPRPSIGLAAAMAGLRATHTLLVSDGSYVYRSTNGGTTWARASQGLPAPGSDVRLWALLAARSGATAYAGTDTGVYRSTDDGRTWHPTSS